MRNPAPSPRFFIHRWPLALGLLALALLSLFNSGLVAASVHLQFALLCLGVGLIIRGFWGNTPLGTWRASHTSTNHWLLLAAILALALILRLWQLDSAIHHPIDEINFMHGVNTLWDNPQTPLLRPFHTVTAFTALYPYLQGHIVNILDPSLGSLRVLSALFGAFNVLALYLLARTLFDDATALLAALTLALFPPHIHFSRIGVNNIADPLFGTLAFTFCWRGLQRGGQRDFAVAGAMLGLTQYFYEGGKLLYPALMLIWLLSGAIFWRNQLQGRWRGLLTMGITALITAAPVYVTLFASRDVAAPRMTTMGLTFNYWIEFLHGLAEGDVFPYEIRHIQQPFLVYTSLPEQGWFYGGDTPLILWYIVPFFGIGLLRLLSRLWTPRSTLLLLWLLLTSLGNILLTESAFFARYVVVFPALALIIGLGMQAVWSIFTRNGTVGAGRRPAPTQKRLLIMAILCLMLVQPIYYFRDHIPQFKREHPPGIDQEDVYFRARHFPPGTILHILDDVYPWDFNIQTILRFLKLDLLVDYTFPQDFDEVYAANLPFGVDHAFFIEPDNPRMLDFLRQHFYLRPAQYSPFDAPPEKQYILYYAPYIPGYSELLR